VSYSVLFLLITAAGIAGLRSDFGIDNLPSRYAMYPALFLAFAWIAIAEEFVLDSGGQIFRNNIFVIAAVCAIVFSVSMDLIGCIYIGKRNLDNTQAMAEFEHPTAEQPAPSPAGMRLRLRLAADTEAFQARARAVLLESMRLGVYQPPPL
jgi:hypothetical protein